MTPSTPQERAAFLAGLGTLTVAQVSSWARELDPMVPIATEVSHVPPNEPLMVHVLPKPDHRGLLGATIIPSVVRSRPPIRRT